MHAKEIEIGNFPCRPYRVLVILCYFSVIMQAKFRRRRAYVRNMINNIYRYLLIELKSKYFYV